MIPNTIITIPIPKLGVISMEIRVVIVEEMVDLEETMVVLNEEEIMVVTLAMGITVEVMTMNITMEVDTMATVTTIGATTMARGIKIQEATLTVSR